MGCVLSPRLLVCMPEEYAKMKKMYTVQSDDCGGLQRRNAAPHDWIIMHIDCLQV